MRARERERERERGREGNYKIDEKEDIKAVWITLEVSMVLWESSDVAAIQSLTLIGLEILLLFFFCFLQICSFVTQSDRNILKRDKEREREWVTACLQ